jgi:hypothetical protein
LNADQPLLFSWLKGQFSPEKVWESRKGRCKGGHENEIKTARHSQLDGADNESWVWHSIYDFNPGLPRVSGLCFGNG